MNLKLLVIGGVAGGATAAARARRLNERAEVILFERGELISFANCGLPYYIGGLIKKRDDLKVTTREAFIKRYNIDIRVFSEVVEINRQKKEVEVLDLASGRTYKESYAKVILAPGAEPIKPRIKGINLRSVFHLRNIPDTDRIKAVIDSKAPESAVVVGGGYIGLEMAENLVLRGVKVTILEKDDQVLSPTDPEMASIVHAHIREQGVILELGHSVEAFEQRDQRVAVVTSEGKQFECDLVISAIGVTPENKLAKEAGLELGPRGHIRVDAAMRTSDTDIYAVGDAVEVTDVVTGMPASVALAGPANKQARIAADNVMGRRSLYMGALGTSIVKVFRLVVAGVGPNEKTLRKYEVPFEVSYSHSGSHASYYPGASQMAIKLIFSPTNGRILGAQVVGQEGVDKRIDVLATAIHGGMTVFDLEELELAYAPPYSSAKDPINVAGFVAANIIKGDLDIVHWYELSQLQKDGAVLIDLRSAKEIKTAGGIPEALHIPLENLRRSLDEFDTERHYIPFCAVGMRGYVAHRILTQNGLKSRNLSGGYRTFAGAPKQTVRQSE